MRTNVEIDPKLAGKLDVLRNQPQRDSQSAAHARAAFLAEAQKIGAAFTQAVPAGEKPRHNGWIHALQSILRFRRKEQTPMFSAIGTVLLIFSIVLGGSGATVAAAQQSLPDDGLYPVKTWSEDVRVRLTENEQTRLQLALDLVNRRAEEMQVMVRAGQVPPPAVETRMQAMIDFALQLSAGQPETEKVQSLTQIRTQLQKHEQEFLQLGPQKNQQGQALIERTRTMLQDRVRICDAGIQDPDQLHDQLRDRDRTQDGDQPWAPGGNPSRTKAGSPVTGTPTPGSGYGPGPGDGTDGPTDGGGNNPWVNDTPTPGSGYGPGPGDGSGECDGCGEGGGNNYQMNQTPAPGSGPGPGPHPDPAMPGDGGSGGPGPGDGSGSGGGTPGSGDGGGGGGGGR